MLVFERLKGNKRVEGMVQVRPNFGVDIQKRQNLDLIVELDEVSDSTWGTDLHHLEVEQRFSRGCKAP